MLQVATLDILSIQPLGIGTAASAAAWRSADAADFAETLDRKMRAADDEAARRPGDAQPSAPAERPVRHRERAPKAPTEDQAAAAEAGPGPAGSAPTRDAAATTPVIGQETASPTAARGNAVAISTYPVVVELPASPDSALPPAATPRTAPAPTRPPLASGAAPSEPKAGQRPPQAIVLTQRFALRPQGAQAKYISVRVTVSRLSRSGRRWDHEWFARYRAAGSPCDGAGRPTSHDRRPPAHNYETLGCPSQGGRRHSRPLRPDHS